MADESRHDEFMQLFLEHQPRVTAYVRSLVFQRADADDVMQEVASVLWRKFDQFEKGTNFDRWALRTAYFQVKALRQRKARESARLQFNDELLDQLSEDSLPILDQTEELAGALEGCLRKLPSKDQQLVALRFSPGATNREVSGKIGKSESVVSRSLTRIYQTLMRCISLQMKLELTP